MKKNNLIVIILGILFSFLSLHAQNTEPGKIPTSQVNWNDAVFSFQQNNFRLGWQWQGASKLAYPLKLNFFHVSTWEMGKIKSITNNGGKLDTTWWTTEDYYYHPPDSGLIIVTAKGTPEKPGLGGNGNHHTCAAGEGCQYEPTLTINSLENVTPIPGDTTGAVFGFRSRNTTVGSNGSGDNFDRFILDPASLSQSPTLVLNRPCPNSKFRYNIKQFGTDTLLNGTAWFLCRRFYIHRTRYC